MAWRYGVSEDVLLTGRGQVYSRPTGRNPEYERKRRANVLRLTGQIVSQGPLVCELGKVLGFF